MRVPVLAASLAAVVACVWQASAAAAFAPRPESMVRSGRDVDDTPPLFSFRDVASWRLETVNATGRVEYANDRVIFGDGACKITFRGCGGKERSSLAFYLPEPVPLPEGCDTLTHWSWGNNVNGRPAGTPAVCLQGIFRLADGTRLMTQLEHVLHARWSKNLLHLSPSLAPRLSHGARLVGFAITNFSNEKDAFIYVDSFSAYREELKPLAFAPRAKRGVRLFPDEPQGVNAGEGTLPFPNTPRTVLPPAKEPAANLEFRTPRNPSDWSDLAFRWKGGAWIPLAHGGGVFPVSAAKDARISFFRDGDSLVCDVVRPAPGVEEVRFGAVVAPDAAPVPVPFWTYGEKGWTNRPCVVTLATGGHTLFVSATPDWTQSNASEMFAGGGLAVANGGVRYRPKTDGTRNGCFERFVWTVSEDFASVLPSIPNPPSPWKHVTGKVAWHALYENRPAYCRDFWRGLRRRGIRHVYASDYGAFWCDYRDKALIYGEGEGFMPSHAAESMGGDAGYRGYVRYIEETLGMRYGLYNDYTDLAPTHPEWAPDNVSRNPDGSFQFSWPGAYSPKPVWAVGACERLAPSLKTRFGFNSGYCDVHTCTTPWKRTDYDARVPGAGTFAQTFYAYGELLLLQRRIWKGPIYSEGGMHWMYAGLADGNYGQDAKYDLPRNPWLVDFDLRRIHPLCCNFGMGHNLNMFYARGIPKEIETTGQSIDRFLAATAAFGHPPYLVINWTNAARSYFMLQALAARYTQAEATEIEYADGRGVFRPTSAAVADGSYRRSQVRVRYSDGTVVVANGSTNETLTARIGNESADIPPSGFWGRSGDGLAESRICFVDGHRAEWARSDEYRYVNGRGRMTRFPDGVSTDGIVVRLPIGEGVEEVIPTGATQVELPYAAARAVILGDVGEEKGPAAFDVRNGRTLLRADRIRSWRISRKEGDR